MTTRPVDFEDLPQPEKPLKLAIVDDHELLLGGLVQALREKPEIAKVVGYQSPAKLIEDLKNGHRFDLVVSDMLMGEFNGLILAREIKHEFQTSVLLMTGVEAPPSRTQLEHHGVTGFVHKTAPIEVLYAAVIAVCAGQPFQHFPDGWDPDKTAQEFGRNLEHGIEDATNAQLSQRQIEVLKLVAAGAANKEIASSLDITENTVKTHMKHIFNALGVTKRTACVQAAKSRGLVE